MKKRIACLTIAIAIIFSLIPSAFAAEYYYANGKQFPNAAFKADGSNPYCQCSMPVGAGYNHWCCWNYAVAAYKYIWGKRFNRYDTSDNYLRDVPAEKRIATADNLREFFRQAMPGAILRLDNDSNPTAGDNYGHSLVFLGLNSSGNGGYFLEANYDNLGRSRIKNRSWTDIANPSRYIKYIMWPGAPVYNPHQCTSWDSTGHCTDPSCNLSFDFDATMDTAKAGYYTVTKSDGTYPRTGGPYDAATKSAYKLKKGQEVKVIGLGHNHYGSQWYKILFNGNTEGYVFSSHLKYSRPLDSTLSINVTWPYEGQTIPKQSHNLMGTVTSNTNRIKTVTGYLDGKKMSTVSVNAMSFNFVKSDIDYAMPFNSISAGRHTIKIVATDTAGGSQSLTRTFYTESSPCEAASVRTLDESWGCKTVIIECSGANIRYTTNHGDSGSGSNVVKAYIKDTTTFTITTAKNGYSDRVIERTIEVPQTLAPQFSTVESYRGTQVTITSTPGAQIYYYFDGTLHGEYCGPFMVTEECTVYAYAMKEGMRDSETTSFKIEATKPNTPSVQLFDSQAKMAVGKTASFRWNTDAKAKEYEVSLFKDGALVKTETQESNIYSVVLEKAGTYELSVKAISPIGNSESSDRVSAIAMAPSTVQFVDDDGSVLAKYTVDYGDCVSKQNQPSHRGYYFSGWYPSNNYYEIPVTEDITYRATYTPIEYDVTFYDVSGTKFGDTQKIPYQKSAVAPDYSSKVPEGYVFAGWTVIEASENDSACDYTCVDANLKLQAVVRWANDELPVYASITSAKLEPEGNKSVYKVNVKLTNWPTGASNVYVVAALKTQDSNTGAWKTVCAERVLVNLDAGSSQPLTAPIKLYYNGIAKKVEVYALERKDDGSTGSAYSQAVSSSVVFSTNYTNWSDWSTTKPESKDGRTIESKTEYRYQDKQTTTSSNSTMSGWTRYDSSWKWSDWGSWSGWSTNYVSSNDSTQVETRTGYHYYYYVCSNCGAHMHGYGRCYTWAGGCGSSAVYSSSYHALKAPVPYSSAKDFHGTGVYYTDNTGEGRGFAYINSGSPYYVAPVTQYRYRSRSQIWTYYFYRWTSWSNWSETKVSSSSTRNVETRTIYRFRDEVPIYDTSAGTEDTTGTAYHFTGEIKAEQNLSGKVATVMVYQSKNMDPNQYQMQYVGQTTLLDGNKYDISFIPIKEPTIESGNYVVALGIQGTTGLLSVDVVEAPKAEYTVRFLMDDGGVISAQTVREGENATVPTIPTKTGYRFIGWSERSTGIFKNVDIIAQFEEEQYLVTFIDWVNESIGFQKYYYGDTISAPYTPTAEGHTFKGWDAILNGNTTVTDNMVVSAVYDKQTFTVQFLDANGKVYQTQQVAYGESAVLPDALAVEGKVFLGWSTDVIWWNVTANIDVAPILAYEETTVAPISNASYTGNRAFVSGMMYDLEFTTEDGATIYYTTDGSEPTRSSNIYNGAIHLEDTTLVTAIAVSDGKNDSECVQVYFVYDDTPVDADTEDAIVLDTKEIDVVPNMSIPLEVEIQYNPGLIGYSLVLECDRSVFYIDAEDENRICTPGDASKYGSFTVTPYYESGWKITWLSSYPSTENGILFTIPLKVGEDAEFGKREVKLGYMESSAYTETGNSISLNRDTVHFAGTDISHTHTYTDAITAPTCTEQGYTLHMCFCGDSYTDTYVDALGHAWDDGVITVQPTDENAGEKTYTCTRCGSTRTEVIPATGGYIPCDGATCPGKAFSDMPAKGNWAHDPIDWAVSNEITNGTSASTFSPEEGCTRAQVVTFLWRAAGKPEPVSSANPFADVNEGAYYYNAVLWAVEKGITNGTSDTTFSPDETCTRAQIVTFLWRYEGEPAPTSIDNPFTDVKTSAYFGNAVLWAVENGITNGTSNTTFSPDDTCTRAQVVTFLYRNVLK